jgi:hypothetical protein
MFEPKKWAIRESSEEQTGGLRSTQLRPLYATRQHDKHGRLRAPKCDICKIIMRIIRREAHPTKGPRYELQTFKCPTCGHTDHVTAVSFGGS